MAGVKDQAEEEEMEEMEEMDLLRSKLLTKVLSLERIDERLYRGSHHLLFRTSMLFGGQIVAQALAAANLTVDKRLHAHSLHSYFVRPGDPQAPVLYHVDLLRSGHSFSVCSVRAVQHGLAIFVCQASFQLEQPSAMEHQCSMPDVPLPESVPTQEELVRKAIRDPSLPQQQRVHLTNALTEKLPMEIRSVYPSVYIRGTQLEPRKLFWVRASSHIGEGDMDMQRCVAAFISDYSILHTVWQPHAQMLIRLMTSLDHSIWFHAPFRTDEWMLYEFVSPWAGSSRGLVLGRVWRRDGTLAMSCAQEGLFRSLQAPPLAAPTSKL